MYSFSQSNLYDEEFKLTFTPTQKSGEWIFKGKDHSFSVTISSNKIEPSESPSYITADNTVIQVMSLPLPKSTLDLTKLSIELQKETLEGYANYELDYFKNEVKINYKKLTKEWITINSKLWLLWTFDSSDFTSSEPLVNKPKFQIYASTICFNQILDINTVVMKDQVLSESIELIKKLMSLLKLSSLKNQRLVE
jgi:hypothetical protein